MKEYSVTGMNCAACSARVEKAVSAVEGVTACSVSLLTNSMQVEGVAAPAEIIASVEKAGYGAALKGGEKKTQAPKEKEKSLLKPLLLSAVILICLMAVSMGHMVGLAMSSWFSPLAQGSYQFVLSLLVLWIHRRFFVGGFRALWHRAPNMDTLVALGSGVSFLYSAALLIRMAVEPEEGAHLLHGLYFESAAMILVLITVGKMLEAYSKGKTTAAIESLQALSPEEARVLRDGVEISVSPHQLHVGDEVVVRPGERFPADCTVLSGEGAVDESALTGESVPADKKCGDAVYTGTVNLSGKLHLRVEKVGEETALSRIIQRVTASSASKAPIARLADRVSGVFVPVVMSLALAAFGINLLFSMPFEVALTRGIAVLVVSCPCALGLATPVAIMVANGVAARHGVLFKTAESLEIAGKTEIVVLDKTGTVTNGKMQVTDVLPALGISREALIRTCVTLEGGSAHPIAAAVKELAEREGIEPLELTDFQSRAGFGVEGCVNGAFALGGKRELIEEATDIPEEVFEKAKSLSEQGKTPLFFASKGEYTGLLALSDTVKEDSSEAVSQMKRMGLRVVMITGDRKETARAIAASCGIEEVHAGVLPAGKEDLVEKLKKEGRVMMVGDGINDAPALTAAHVGVAIGAGMDVAMDASQVVLMNSALSDVPRLIALSRKTLLNIKENLFWAFCYNLIGIPLAAGAFSVGLGWELTPMFGAAAMSVSSFLVISNALRLNFFSWGEANNDQQTKKKENKTMEKIIGIEGMMCPHCEAHVKKALEAIPGVKEVTADHVKKQAVVILEGEVSDEILKETVVKEGYKVL